MAFNTVGNRINVDSLFYSAQADEQKDEANKKAQKK